MVVALIGAIGVVTVALIGLASSQAQQRNLREKLRKDSETLGHMRQGSYAHQQLSTWIDEMTYRLVLLEWASERNRFARTTFLRCTALWVVTAGLVVFVQFVISPSSVPELTKNLYVIGAIAYVCLSGVVFLLYGLYFLFSRRAVWKSHQKLRHDKPQFPEPPPRPDTHTPETTT